MSIFDSGMYETLIGNGYQYSPFLGQPFIRDFLHSRGSWRTSLARVGRRQTDEDHPGIAAEFEKKKKDRLQWPISRLLSVGASVAECVSELQNLNVLSKVLDLIFLRRPEVSESEVEAIAYLLDKEKESLGGLLSNLPSIDRSSPDPTFCGMSADAKAIPFGIVLSRSPRGLNYVKGLASAGAKLVHVALMRTDPFVPESAWTTEDESSLLKLLPQTGWNVTEVDASRVSEESVLNIVKRSELKHWVYTGGGILPKGYFESGRKFLHIHPGIIPRYRGSTVFYFSVLEEGRVGATAFEMSTDLDNGPIVAQRHYRVPETANWDTEFDPLMRTDLLLRALPRFLTNLTEPPQREFRAEFTIIHPVLKHIALLHATLPGWSPPADL